MKTLYTGHATVGTHDVYSFIYAETVLDAEEHLVTLLTCYLRDYHLPFPAHLPQIKIVSRPTGWMAPDGFYLPATSKQYALRYPSQQLSRTPQETESSFQELAPEPLLLLSLDASQDYHR